MKEAQLKFKKEAVLENKIHRLQNRISSRYWFGWAGNYLGNHKKQV